MEEARLELGLEERLGVCQVHLAREVVLSRSESKSHSTGRF